MINVIVVVGNDDICRFIAVEILCHLRVDLFDEITCIGLCVSSDVWT